MALDLKNYEPALLYGAAITASTTTTTLTSTSDVTVGGNLAVTGTSAFTDAITMASTLAVTGVLTYATLNDGTTALAATALEINRWVDTSGRLVAAGSTLSATQALHDGKIIKLDTAAGSTVTLPAATGTGMVLKFIISVIATSNNHIIKVASSADTMAGIILTGDDTGAAVYNWQTAADTDTITLNRTTTGSTKVGEWIELVDIANTVWAVKGVIANTGSQATPFSATV